MPNDDLARVPGCQWDIFISYAHLDNEPVGLNPGWVDSFHAELKRRLGEKLGCVPQIFFDALAIRKAEDFNVRIKNGISRSALFIAIVSNGYLKRRYCAKEYSYLVEWFRDRGGITFPRGSRCLEVIADVPDGWADQSKLVPGSAGYLFCSKTSRFDPSDKDRFGAALEILSGEIKVMLDELRAPFPSIVMPPPLDDDGHERVDLENYDGLRKHWHDKRFRIIPDTEIYKENDLIKALESAALSVFFIGRNEDALRPLVEKATRTGRPVVVTIGIRDTTKSFASELKKDLEATNLECLTARPDLLPDLKTTTERILSGGTRPHEPDAAQPEGNSVYLICDDPSDATVQLWIDKIDARKCGFTIPFEAEMSAEYSLPDVSKIKEINADRLRQSGKVALVWGTETSGQWFRQQIPIVKDASARSKRRAVHLVPPKTKEKDGAYARIAAGSDAIQVIYRDDDAIRQAQQIDAFLGA